jgi:hypothetical protein
MGTKGRHNIKKPNQNKDKKQAGKQPEAKKSTE